jgi:hypothetical protein
MVKFSSREYLFKYKQTTRLNKLFANQLIHIVAFLDTEYSNYSSIISSISDVVCNKDRQTSIVVLISHLLERL